MLAFESWETEAGNGLEIYQSGLDYFCSKFQYEILDPSLKLKLGYFLRFLWGNCCRYRVDTVAVYTRLGESPVTSSPSRASLCLNEFCLQILDILGRLNLVDSTRQNSGFLNSKVLFKCRTKAETKAEICLMRVTSYLLEWNISISLMSRSFSKLIKLRLYQVAIYQIVILDSDHSPISYQFL